MAIPKEDASTQNVDTREPEVFEFTEAELPRIKEERALYCGLNTLSIVLEYYRRRGELPEGVTEADLAPDNLHQRFLDAIVKNRLPTNNYEGSNEAGTGTVLKEISPTVIHPNVHKPNAFGLAWLARDISEDKLSAGIIAGRKWNDLDKGNPAHYLKRLILNRIPVITRTGGHFRVAMGVDERRKTIQFYDTNTDEIIVRDEARFDESWRIKPSSYSANLHHMMIVIHPRREKPRSTRRTR